MRCFRQSTMTESDDHDRVEPEPGDDPHSDSAAAWQGLADVAAAAATHLWGDVDGEVAQFISAEQRSHTVHERLSAAGWVVLECQGGQSVEGQVLTVYRDCVLVDTTRAHALVMISAIVALRHLPLKVNPPTAMLGGELAAASALSRWLTSGITVWRCDGAMLSGDLVAVWADCADVVSRAMTLTIPFAAIALVTSEPAR